MIKTDGLPRLSDYAAARKHWDDVKPVRGYEDSMWKPVGRRDKHGHMRMRKKDDGTIVIRLYHTDVMEYHPDGAMTFKGYNTTSTQQFVDAIAPHDITPAYLHSVGYCLGFTRRDLTHLRHYENKHFYLMDHGSLSIERRGDRAEWYPIGEPPQFETVVLDRESTQAALAKYPKYRDFSDFVRAYVAIKGDDDRTRWQRFSQRYGVPPYEDALKMMQAGQWKELVSFNGLTGLAPIAYIRKAIYMVEGVDTCSSYQPYVTGYSGLKSVRASRTRYSWLNRHWR
jgi:hypothetical protein